MKLLLHVAVWFILSVCVYDIFCTVRYSSEMIDGERNPVAKLLIHRTPHAHRCLHCATNKELSQVFYETDVSGLVGVKLCGVLAAQCVFGWLLNSPKQAIATAVILSVLAVQIGLLVVLTC